MDDYFAEYTEYYNELNQNTDYEQIATQYEENINMAILGFEGLKSFVNSSSIEGEYKKAINETLNILNDDYETLKYNMENSLVPTSEQLKKLEINLQSLEEKNNEYKLLEENRNSLLSKEPSMYVKVKTKDGYKNVYNQEYIAWQNSLNNLNGAISLKLDEINMLKKEIDETLNKIKILESLIKDFSSSLSSSNAQMQVVQNNQANLFYWKIDDVVYQLVSPICLVGDKEKNVVLDENYIIVYDMNKIKERLGEENIKYYESLEKTLNDRLNGTETYWYDYEKQDIKKPETINAITTVMNTVLEDAYEANKDVSRAIISTFITTNSVVNFKYNNAGNAVYSVGFDEIAKKGQFDCIALIRWGEYQEIKELDPNGQHRMDNTTVPFNPKNIMYHYSDTVNSLSDNELSNLEVGSVLTKEFIDKNSERNYHIGRIIGHTTIDGENAIVVSQASGHGIGLINSVYKVSEMKNSWYGVADDEVILDFAINGDFST